MKSNITKMITMCVCMMVVGFAAEEKMHLNEVQAQNPISIEMQDKDYAVTGQKMRPLSPQQRKDMFIKLQAAKKR